MVNLGNQWDALLAEEFKKDYYLKLRSFLKEEYSNYTVYPDMHDIFNALKTVDYSKVKVVILGQDPYHEPGQAHGMSFSVKPGIETPPSLVNIYKEIAADVGPSQLDNGYLMPWAEQGVLLLNAVLTVRAHCANSHKGKGWEMLTDKVISILNERPDPVVFLLWGANARAKKVLITGPQHLVLEAPHPSPLSAYNGFFGCKHFSKTNAFLEEHQKEPIRW